MIGLDTNVLVRLLVRDDEDQHRRALSALERRAATGERFFVPDIVLVEIVWVLRKVYRRPKDETVAVVRALLETAPFEFESVDDVRQALDRCAGGQGDFADYLVAARARGAGCSEVLTFDRALLEEEGFREP